jgi:hypothetical protein
MNASRTIRTANSRLLCHCIIESDFVFFLSVFFSSFLFFFFPYHSFLFVHFARAQNPHGPRRYNFSRKTNDNERQPPRSSLNYKNSSRLWPRTILVFNNIRPGEIRTTDKRSHFDPDNAGFISRTGWTIHYVSKDAISTNLFLRREIVESSF